VAFYLNLLLKLRCYQLLQLFLCDCHICPTAPGIGFIDAPALGSHHTYPSVHANAATERLRRQWLRSGILWSARCQWPKSPGVDAIAGGQHIRSSGGGRSRNNPSSKAANSNNTTDNANSNSHLGLDEEESVAGSYPPTVAAVEDATTMWPSMQDLNTRLRRVITAYQRNYKKEELKLQQKAKVSTDSLSLTNPVYPIICSSLSPPSHHSHSFITEKYQYISIQRKKALNWAWLRKYMMQPRKKLNTKKKNLHIINVLLSWLKPQMIQNLSVA